MKTLIPVLFLCISTAACASTPGVAEKKVIAAASSEHAAGTICTKKKELGSNQVKRVCTTEAERQAAKEKADTDLQRAGRCASNETECTGGL